MATYLTAPAHERLNVFFGNFFREMRKAEPSTYGAFLTRAEQEFRRLGYRDEISGGVENILIVRLDAIGDMVLTSGFIRELRKNFPQARITLVVSPLVYPIVELCPYVNEILTINQNLPAENFVDMFERFVVLCRDNFWSKNFSIAFLPRWHNDTFWNAMTAWLSGARERIGYGTYPFQSWLGNPSPEVAVQDNFLLTQNIVTPKSIVADVEKNFYLLTSIGLIVDQTNMELWFSAADALCARELLKDIPSDCKKVLVCTGARQLNRRYPVEKYFIAFQKLAEKNLVFVIVGGTDDLDDANFIEQNLPPGKVLNLVGKTTLRQTEAIATMMDFYIGNDTSVMHMAAAAQVPVLALYREAADKENIATAIFSEYRRFYPWQTNSVTLRPDHQLDDCAQRGSVYGWCHHVEQPHCITQITPQEIIDGFEILCSM